MIKTRLIIKLAAGLIILAFAAVLGVTLTFRSGDSFEPWSWKRKAVWTSKRLVAESAALAFRIWDPYTGGQVAAITGPVAGTEDLPDLHTFETAGELKAWLTRIPGLEGIEVTDLRNGSISPSSLFKFSYQIFGEPKLDSLRSLYSLDTLSAGAESDYQILCRLSDWLTMYLDRSRSGRDSLAKVDYNFNALDILNRAGQGEKFWCSEYSTSLVQCLAALGFTGRYVMVNSETGGHVTAEAWCDTFGKWVMLDPYFGLRVILDGIPLSVLEVHELALDPQTQARVEIEQAHGEYLDPEWREFYFSLFRTFAVRMRNDWFTNRYPHWHPLSNSVMNAVEWQDNQTFDNIFYKHETTRKTDLYWPLNEVRLRPRHMEGRLFRMNLDTFTPNFSHFMVQLDSLPDLRYEGTELDWTLHPGRNRISVRAVNNMGRAGRRSSIELILDSTAAIP